MSSGCCIIASDVAPVRECAHPQATFFVDHTNTVKVAKVLTKVIELSEKDRQDRHPSEGKAIAGGLGAALLNGGLDSFKSDT